MKSSLVSDQVDRSKHCFHTVCTCTVMTSTVKPVLSGQLQCLYRVCFLYTLYISFPLVCCVMQYLNPTTSLIGTCSKVIEKMEAFHF